MILSSYAFEIKKTLYHLENNHQIYYSHLTKLFKTPDEGFPDSKLFKLIVKMPIKSFVTTNYDTAIEYFLNDENYIR